MRGINFLGQVGNSIDPAFKVSPKYYGNGDLMNGQWWPLEICALRDGAHGQTQAGISGEKGEGAYSVVVSGGHDYPDRASGNELLYCGTDSNDSAPTTNTHIMLDSVGKHPVRLIRSHNLDSPYAPNMGFRYDGLYNVVSYEMLDPPDSQRQRHRFKLVRVVGQDPIRGGDSPETRPTRQEREQYQKYKRFTGK